MVAESKLEVPDVEGAAIDGGADGSRFLMSGSLGFGLGAADGGGAPKKVMSVTAGLTGALSLGGGGFEAVGAGGRLTVVGSLVEEEDATSCLTPFELADALTSGFRPLPPGTTICQCSKRIKIGTTHCFPPLRLSGCFDSLGTVCPRTSYGISHTRS